MSNNAFWDRSNGAIRHWLENSVSPPLGEEAQKEAGLAAAANALAEKYGIDIEDLSSGLDSVSGARSSAGARDIPIPDPDIPQDAGAAAFFDVDNTLIQGSSLAQLAIEMARRGMLRPSDIAPVLWKQLKFMLSGSENASDVAAARSQALELVKGRNVADLIDIGEEIVDNKILSKTYAGTRALAQMHLAAGQQVWLVTATPVQLAHILADRLGFTGALGTVAEEEEGEFTGRLTGDILHGPGKAHAVAALAAVMDLDLERCTAYSDSANDLPMLNMVGTPVAINPDSRLKKVAKKRDWEIRDFRSVRSSALRVTPALVLVGACLAALRYRKAQHPRKDIQG